MAAAEQAPIAAPAFAVVRRGYDPDQVAHHLSRVDAETTILAADRAAAVEQAAQLSQQLSSCRKDLDAARTEIERLRTDLRVLAGPPDTIDSMNGRLQVMLRLAKDEFVGLRADASAHAAAHAAAIIAAVDAEAGDVGYGFDESELRGPRDEEELEQMRREAAAERTRLDEEANARRAAADEEFRQVLALRCHEAMAQLAKLQTEALRTARRVVAEADEQARVLLADAKEAVRQTVDDAQREVDDLQELWRHLAVQLDTSRHLLDRAIPAARTATADDGGAPTQATQATDTPAPPAGPPSPTPRATADPAATSAPQAEHVTAQLAPPTLPALASLPVPKGWPVAPGSVPAPPAGSALEQSQPGLAGGTPGAGDSPRAQPMRVPPRDPESPDIPGPSRIPQGEQETQIAPPRRYP
jgi:hypothetical protein